MIEKANVTRAVFYGLGADGTVGANKNSVKIIAEDAGLYAQGYFVYDSHKSGAQTVSHLALRPGADPRALPDRSGRVRRLPSVHGAGAAGSAARGGARRHGAAERTLSGGGGLGPAAAPGAADHHRPRSCGCSSSTPRPWRARSGSASRTNTVLQTCFFAHLRRAAARQGDRPDQGRDPQDLRRQGPGGRRPELRRGRRHPGAAAAKSTVPAAASPARSKCRRWCRPTRRTSSATSPRDLFAGLGDRIPVSLIPADGTFPSGTAAFEKRNISDIVPVWREDLCVQCGQCSFVCPHSVIRAEILRRRTSCQARRTSFKSAPVNARGYPGRALHLAILCRGLHRLRPVRRGLPGDQPARGQRQGHQHARTSCRCWTPNAPTSRSSKPCRSTIAPASISPTSAACSSWSRCSSSPAPAAAAARRPISNCSASCSAIERRSPTPPAVPRSMAAICRSRRGRRTPRAAARPGRIRCSRTMPNSVSAFASPPTSIWNSR